MSTPWHHTYRRGWLDLRIAKYNKGISTFPYIFVLLSGIWNDSTNPTSLPWGVLQGPILGPILFSLFYHHQSFREKTKSSILFNSCTDWSIMRIYPADQSCPAGRTYHWALAGICFCVLRENCNVRHELEVYKRWNVHVNCSLESGENEATDAEDKQTRTQTNTRAADHWAQGKGRAPNCEGNYKRRKKTRGKQTFPDKSGNQPARTTARSFLLSSLIA